MNQSSANHRLLRPHALAAFLGSLSLAIGLLPCGCGSDDSGIPPCACPDGGACELDGAVDAEDANDAFDAHSTLDAETDSDTADSAADALDATDDGDEDASDGSDGSDALESDSADDAAPEADAPSDAPLEIGPDAEAGVDSGLETLAVCEAILCSQCHGQSGTLNCAPPIDTAGRTLNTDRGVGAHQIHLSTGPEQSSVASRTVVCSDCHVVPAASDIGGVPTHFNGTADVIFSGPAGKQVPGGAVPTFDPSTGTCSNVFCHAPGKDPGGFNNDPTFNVPSSAMCGSCHGLPPPAPHPQNGKCFKCHGGVLGENGAWIDPTLHIDGELTISGCNGCHGDSTSAAPPAALSGENATTAIGVGAHRAHVAASTSQMLVPHKVFACSQCHHMPGSVGDPAHLDGDNRAEVTFPASEGSIASADGVAASFSHASATCTTYCHGASLAAANPSPLWTIPAPGDGNVSCGSCHGLPPIGHYPATIDSCDACHGQVVQFDASKGSFNFVNPDLHVNGTVDVNSGCSDCHGGMAGNNVASAPPFDLDTPAGTSNTDPQVGAHQAHLAQNASQMGLVTNVKHMVIPCSACHIVPTSIKDDGHLDALGRPAEVVFGGVGAEGTVPVLNKTDPSKPTCSNYCHGATLCDGFEKTPSWNGGASEAICGACHGIPPVESRGSDDVCGGTPGFKHSSNLGLHDCATCHPATMKKVNSTWEFVNDGECHINGHVSTASCDK